MIAAMVLALTEQDIITAMVPSLIEQNIIAAMVPPLIEQNMIVEMVPLLIEQNIIAEMVPPLIERNIIAAMVPPLKLKIVRITNLYLLNESFHRLFNPIDILISYKLYFLEEANVYEKVAALKESLAQNDIELLTGDDYNGKNLTEKSLRSTRETTPVITDSNLSGGSDVERSESDETLYISVNVSTRNHQTIWKP